MTKLPYNTDIEVELPDLKVLEAWDAHAGIMTNIKRAEKLAKRSLRDVEQLVQLDLMTPAMAKTIIEGNARIIDAFTELLSAVTKC
jgi:hypothetical protein